MELIQVFYNIIIFSGGLLILVILFSFIMSRTNHQKTAVAEPRHVSNISYLINQMKLNQEHDININERLQEQIGMEYLSRTYNYKPQTVHEQLIDTKDSQKPNWDRVRRSKGKTNGKGNRYTIVNEINGQYTKPHIMKFR